ncbi:hypothetical protein PGTUg99_026613 [Puccinia graminis f. sp. tritici]|uniref:Uncharacterized protein n=1 Tax=Puccinia graminis f. sp. tritici TaxID=56615 RepID=A0A5B0NYC2_PUCGR|nr:hypothetical protein PGTUg99_026613 [Puccinia graminis f. sp. tritici]
MWITQKPGGTATTQVWSEADHHGFGKRRTTPSWMKDPAASLRSAVLKSFALHACKSEVEQDAEEAQATASDQHQ